MNINNTNTSVHEQMSQFSNYLERELIDEEINLLIERDNLQNDPSIKEWLNSEWEWPDETEMWGLHWFFNCVSEINDDLLEILSRCNNTEIRENVAKQIYTFEFILLRLSKDDDKDVRRAANESLKSREEHRVKGDLDRYLTSNIVLEKQRYNKAVKDAQIHNKKYKEELEKDETLKWNCANSIVCGIDPLTDYFFVGTKSVFKKESPIICVTESQIDRYYTGDFNQILKECLKYLPSLGINCILEGDILFLESTKKLLNNNGKEYISFTPNSIEYSTSVNNELGKKIYNSKLGIVFHTKYFGGNSLKEEHKAQSVDQVPNIVHNNDVLIFERDFKKYSDLISSKKTI